MRSECFTNRRGSASVIVIMVMLLLVVFGILAFVSGGSSLKLAEKHAQTVRDYYLLDKQGEIAVGRISALIKAESSGQGFVPRIRQATGIQDVTALPVDSENPVLTIQIQDPSLGNGASLRIRMQPKIVSSGALGLEIQEWKLIYKPFTYDGSMNLWDGGDR